MRPITLLAVPNPFASLDDAGRAQSVVPLYRTSDRYLGAEPDQATSTATGRRVFHIDTTAPVKLVCRTPDELGFYRRFFETGELLAGDQATATALNLKTQTKSTAEKATPRPFVAPATALEAAKATAVAAHTKNHGWEPACAHRHAVANDAQDVADAHAKAQAEQDAAAKAAQAASDAALAAATAKATADAAAAAASTVTAES